MPKEHRLAIVAQLVRIRKTNTERCILLVQYVHTFSHPYLI
jgi:hypothetical protein